MHIFDSHNPFLSPDCTHSKFMQRGSACFKAEFMNKVVT